MLQLHITAYVGSKGLSVLSNFAAPLIFIMSLVGAGLATSSVGGWSQLSVLSESCKGGSVTFSVAVVAVVGAFATGGIIQPDITRFCKSAKTSVIATIIGFIVAQGGVITAGYIMCVVAKTGDVATALLGILGGWSLLILIFAQWTTNDNNLYSSSLAICSLFPKFNKHIVVLVVAAVAILAGATGVVNNFVAFLSFLGVTVPPVGGVVAADYFIMKKMNYNFGKGTRYGFISIPTVISWLAGAAVGNFVHWGIGAINALVVAFVLYLILEQIFKNDPDKQYVGGFYVEDEYGDLAKE